MHPSKEKGIAFEKRLEAEFHRAGLRCRAAFGRSSNGRTLTTDEGHPCGSSVDLLVNGRLRVQAKLRSRVADDSKPPDGAHVTVVAEDEGEPLAVIPLPLLLRLLRTVYGEASSGEHPAVRQ